MTFLQWIKPWDPSPVIILATIIAALLFFRHRKPLQLYQSVLFWIGLAAMYFVLQTQFEYYAEHSFFVHQLQQGVLHHFGPFLIALSGINLHPANNNESPAGRKENHILAVLLFNAIIIFWLIPPVHQIAMLDWRLYRLMNWSMIINGLIFWQLALSPRRPGSARILMMLALIPPQIIIGALVFLTPQDLYPIYSLCGRIFTGISPITDQQIGGLVLWLTGPMMSAIGIFIVARREWLKMKRLA